MDAHRPMPEKCAAAAEPLACLTGPPFAPPPDQPATLADYIRELVRRNPQGRYVEIDGTGRTRTRTYDALFRQACYLSRLIDSQQNDSAQSILVCFESILDFVPAAWACLFTGAHCAPCPVNDLHRSPENFAHRTQAILEKLDPAIVFTQPDILETLCHRYRCCSEHQVIDTSRPPPPSPFTRPLLSGHSRGSGDFLISTSGTTGAPKLAVLPETVLANRFFDGFPSDDRSCLYCLAHYTVSGIRMLIPLGRYVVYLQPQRLLGHPIDWFRAINQYEVTDIGLSSSIAAILNEELNVSIPALDLSSLQRLALGAEIVVPSVVQQMIAHLRGMGAGDFSVTSTYSMTETGPLCRAVRSATEVLSSSADHAMLDGFTECVPGWKVRIADETDRVLTEGEPGRIQVYSDDKLFAGYLDGTGQNTSSFTGDGWFSTGDLGRIEGGTLLLTGREKNTIIVNARKIACEELESRLRSIDGILPNSVVVCAYRAEATSSDEVAVFVVPQSSDDASLQTLKKRILREVAKHAGARVKHLVPIRADEIERTPTFKIRRDKLVSKYRERAWRNLIDENLPARLPSSAAPTSDLLQIWRDQLDLNELPTLDDDFFDLGGDSLAAARLIGEVEELYELELPVSDFFQQPTIRRMLNFIRAGTTPGPARPLHQAPQASRLLREIETRVATWQGQRRSPDSLIVGLNSSGDRPPLFWVFQSYEEFNALAKAMGPAQPIYGMRSCVDILSISEYQVDTLQCVIDRYLWEVLDRIADQPFVLGGNCQGSILAFLLANRLKQIDRTPALLAFLEWSFSYGPYAAPLFAMYGKESSTAALYTRDPEYMRRFRESFPNATCRSVPGYHGKFFDEPNCSYLSATLREHMQQALTQLCAI